MNKDFTKKELKQRSNLARTAIFLLENEVVKFNMGSYLSINDESPLSDMDLFWNPDLVSRAKNECGTSCCFAGHGPLALRNVKKDEEWDDYCTRVFGAEELEEGKAGDVWRFLFSWHWPNNKKQAAARALVYLRGDMPPSESIYDSRDEFYLKSYSKTRLIQELQAYV